MDDEAGKAPLSGFAALKAKWNEDACKFGSPLPSNNRGVNNISGWDGSGSDHDANSATAFKNEPAVSVTAPAAADKNLSSKSEHDIRASSGGSVGGGGGSKQAGGKMQRRGSVSSADQAVSDDDDKTPRRRMMPRRSSMGTSAYSSNRGVEGEDDNAAYEINEYVGSVVDVARLSLAKNTETLTSRKKIGGNAHLPLVAHTSAAPPESAPRKRTGSKEFTTSTATRRTPPTNGDSSFRKRSGSKDRTRAPYIQIVEYPQKSPTNKEFGMSPASQQTKKKVQASRATTKTPVIVVEPVASSPSPVRLPTPTPFIPAHIVATTSQPAARQTSKKLTNKKAGRGRKQQVIYTRQLQKIPDLPVYAHTDQEEDTILQALYNCNLFSTLRVGQLGQLVAAFEACTASAGDIVLQQDDPVEAAPYFYIIDRGIVEFTVHDQHVGTAGAGSSFGDLALLYSSPRSCTVLALEDVKMYRVDALTFRCILSAETQRCVHKKCRLTEQIHFFSDATTELSDMLVPRTFRAGETLIKQGDATNPALFIIADGMVHSRVASTGSSEQVGLKPGDYFGERSLVAAHEPSPATFVAASAGLAFCLDRASFAQIIDKAGLAAVTMAILNDQNIRRLSAVHFLQQHAGGQITALAALLKDRTYNAGESVLIEKDITKAALFLVKQGSLTIRSGDNTTKAMSVGGSFGEALLQRAHSRGKKSTKSPYSVAAKTNCVCSVLSIKDFWSVVGPPESVVASVATTAAATAVPSESAAAAIDAVPADPFAAAIATRATTNDDEPAKTEDIVLVTAPPKRPALEKARRQPSFVQAAPLNIKLEQLHKHSVLGEGTFGIVWLVSDETKKEGNANIKPYALKKQSKAFLVGENQVEAVIQEKIMLENMKHPFLIRLEKTYQDEYFVYMLLDFVQGGELFSLMHESDDECPTLPEHQAKFYALCLADVLHYLHKNKYVYRDLKPENVMLDSQGYVKLIDFGFCKYLLAEKTYTLCGTPGYLPPETVTVAGHSFSSDNWSLGILIYEMIAGYSAFYYEGIDQMELFASIVNDRVQPPVGASAQASDLVTKLLNKDPAQRLGSRSPGEILEHAWFAELDVEAMRHRECVAPWVPIVEGPLDTSYFNDWSELERDTENETSASESGDISKKGQALSKRDQKLFEGIF